jgi:hypothetical protein
LGTGRMYLLQRPRTIVGRGCGNIHGRIRDLIVDAATPLPSQRYRETRNSARRHVSFRFGEAPPRDIRGSGPVAGPIDPSVPSRRGLTALHIAAEPQRDMSQAACEEGGGRRDGYLKSGYSPRCFAPSHDVAAGELDQRSVGVGASLPIERQDFSFARWQRRRFRLKWLGNERRRDGNIRRGRLLLGTGGRCQEQAQ